MHVANAHDRPASNQARRSPRRRTSSAPTSDSAAAAANAACGRACSENHVSRKLVAARPAAKSDTTRLRKRRAIQYVAGTMSTETQATTRRAIETQADARAM